MKYVQFFNIVVILTFLEIGGGAKESVLLLAILKECSESYISFCAKVNETVPIKPINKQSLCTQNPLL